MIALRTVRRVSNAECRNRGFTLLEMLLVTILTATLMSGIWGISSLYLDLLQTGKLKTEEAQLVRALTRQISEDLLGVVQPFEISESPAGAGVFSALPSSVSATLPTGFNFVADGTHTELQRDGGTRFNISASSTLPEFELIGTERELRLNVLQVVHPDTLRHVEPNSRIVVNREDPESQPAPSRVPELKTIVYTFEEPRELVPNDRRPPVGLMRRELPWDQTFSSRSATPFGRRPAEFTGASEFTKAAQFVDDDDFGPARVLEAEWLEADESVTLIPEVVAIKFRYFDGQAWRDNWNSHARKTLPVAVEIVIRVMSLMERELLYGVSEEPERVDGVERVDREQDEMDVQTTPTLGRVHRKLVFLPAARTPQRNSARSAFGAALFPVTSNPFSGGRP